MISTRSISVLLVLSFFTQAAFSDILVSSRNKISVYSSVDNSLVSTTNVDQPSSNDARDLVRLSDGRVAIFNGVFDPKLSIWNQTANTWVHYTFENWGIPNNVSYGGIASNGQYIYVTDGLSGDNGLIRFDKDTGSAERFLEELNTGYIDVTMGLDGYIYALRNTYGDLDKIDPSTMSSVKSIDLGHLSSSRAIAVDMAGFIYMASWNGSVVKYDSAGLQISSTLLTGNLYDIDIHPDGQLIVSERFGDIFVRDFELAEVTNFSIGSDGSFVAYSSFSPIDSDSDGIPDASDNCPRDFNTDQADENENGVGDACEQEPLEPPLGNNDDDFLLLIMPAVIASITKNTENELPPEWGVVNSVCCPTSRANFSLTLNGASRFSSVQSCSAEPTFQGFSDSTVGSKSLSGLLSSAGCGNLPYSVSADFEASKRYLFSLELKGSRPTLILYAGPRVANKKTSSVNPSELASPMIKIKEVTLKSLPGIPEMNGFKSLK